MVVHFICDCCKVVAEQYFTCLQPYIVRVFQLTRKLSTRIARAFLIMFHDTYWSSSTFINTINVPATESWVKILFRKPLQIFTRCFHLMLFRNLHFYERTTTPKWADQHLQSVASMFTVCILVFLPTTLDQMLKDILRGLERVSCGEISTLSNFVL